MTKYQTTAKNFWKAQKIYPLYQYTKDCRLYEINYLIPNIINSDSLLDLGCGDGALIKCLQQLTHINKYYAYDVSSSLMGKFTKDVITKVYDCTAPTKLPLTDVTVIGSVLPFLLDDNKVLKLFDKIKSDKIYVSAPCTEKKEDELIRVYSKQFKCKYVAKYRTIENVLTLLRQKFTILDMIRTYPDSIESEFGTKHYYFELTQL